MKLVRSLGVALVGLSMAHVAAAQPAGAKGEDFLYRVLQGDTLGELAQRYTENFANWSALQSLNGVADPTRLPIAKVLRIPFSMIPMRASFAHVQHTYGAVSISGQTPGIQVAEGQTIQTGPGGFVALQLADESIVTVPPSSTLVLRRLRAFRAAGLTDSIFELESGSVETRVAPNETGVGRFEVRTPASVTGVRGTSLRVHAATNGSRSEVVTGVAGVEAKDSSEHLVRERQGVAVDTSGHSLGVRPLLPAPTLEDPSRGSGGWVAGFNPVPGARGYVVSVAKDAAGGYLVSQQTIEGPPARFSASGPGTHYVFVRALDDDGIGGLDARTQFEGTFVLMDGAGAPIVTGSGSPVVVADY